jgi:hypothetical protein
MTPTISYHCIFPHASIFFHTVFPLTSYLKSTDVYQNLSAFVESYLMIHVNSKRHKKKLSRILFNNLVITNYNAFLMLLKLEYQDGVIKDEKYIRNIQIYNTVHIKSSL